MLSHDQMMVVNSASRLAGVFAELGLDLPERFAERIAAYRAAEDYQQTAIPNATELDEATPETVTAVIARMADAKVREAAIRDVRTEAMSRLGRALIRQLREDAPALVDEIARVMRPLLSRFVEVYRDLPSGYTDPAALVEAGSDAVEAFNSARTMVGPLEAIRSTRDFLAQYGGAIGGDRQVELGTRFAVVRNTGSARRAALGLAEAARHPLGFAGALLDVDGVEDLDTRSLDEHARYVSKLPVVEDDYQPSARKGFSGSKRVLA